MFHRIYQITLLATLTTLPLLGDTMWLVYNMRIAATTRQEEAALYKSLASGTFIDIEREHYNGLHTGVTGGLASYIHTEPDWYARLDFAAANVHAKAKTLKASFVQTDDILLSGGYCVKPDDHTKLTFSGLFGIPTHDNRGLVLPQLGTGHFGLGVQVDGIFKFPATPQHSVEAAIRIVHFLPERISVTKDCITHRLDVDFGNLFDLFVAYVGVLGEKRLNILEVGYNPQIDFHSSVGPTTAGIITDVDYIRHIFYTSWTCRFSINSERPHATSFGFSYAFDSKPAKSPTSPGNKRILVGWFSWGINF